MSIVIRHSGKVRRCLCDDAVSRYLAGHSSPPFATQAIFDTNTHYILPLAEMAVIRDSGGLPYPDEQPSECQGSSSPQECRDRTPPLICRDWLASIYHTLR